MGTHGGRGGSCSKTRERGLTGFGLVLWDLGEGSRRLSLCGCCQEAEGMGVILREGILINCTPKAGGKKKT